MHCKMNRALGMKEWVSHCCSLSFTLFNKQRCELLSNKYKPVSLIGGCMIPIGNLYKLYIFLINGDPIFATPVLIIY